MKCALHFSVFARKSSFSCSWSLLFLERKVSLLLFLLLLLLLLLVVVVVVGPSGPI